MPSKRQLARFFKNISDAKGNRTKLSYPPNRNRVVTISKPARRIMATPKISIVTYVYCTEQNGRWRQLSQNIESIHSQNYPNYEHIIVDDGSPIDLEHLIKSLKDSHIKYIRKPHTGILENTKTFNCGLKVVTGKYCMILSSDDIHIPGTMMLLSNYLESHPKFIAVTGSAIHEVLSRNGKVISSRKNVIKDKIPIHQMLIIKNCINACATMFRSEVLKKIQLPPDQTGFAADYDLWVRISEHGTIFRIANSVIKYRNFGNATRILTQKDQAYRQKCINYVKATANARRKHR
jgi:glycosyltransferase involved in cell wall biosynthesis